MEFRNQTLVIPTVLGFTTRLSDLCNINNVLATSGWFIIDIYIIFKENKTSETSNMSIPTSDSFREITKQMKKSMPKLRKHGKNARR